MSGSSSFKKIEISSFRRVTPKQNHTPPLGTSQNIPTCDEMPEDYIEFDERFRNEVALSKLSKDAFRERVHSYAVQLVQSVCSGNELCTMTRTVIGGFHICTFFNISSNDQIGTKRWVLRVPIPGQHGGDLLDEKFRSERIYLSANVAIPTARLVTYGLLNGPHPGRDYFMILEYVEGEMLVRDLSELSKLSDKQTETLYSSLSDILLELWNHPFERIGSITLRDDGEPDAVNLTRPLMLEFNNLQLDGVDVSSVIPLHQTFGTATQYFNSLADLHMERLLQQRNSIETEKEAELKYMNRINFKQAICCFVEPRSDNGRFVIMLGDMSPQNILIDETGAIKAILDLEWTSIRPVQCIGPPVWLSGVVCGDVIVSDEEELKKFQACFELFVNIFKRQEALRFQECQSPFSDPGMRLSDFMQAGLSSGRYWFAEAVGSFYGFDGLFRWSLARHIPHTTDSMMTIVARWVGRRKLDDLHALDPVESLRHNGASGPKGTTDSIDRASNDSGICIWPYVSISLASIVIVYLGVIQKAKLA